MILLSCLVDQCLDLIGLFFAPRASVVIGTVVMVMDEEVDGCTKVEYHVILFMYMYKERMEYKPDKAA